MGRTLISFRHISETNKSYFFVESIAMLLNTQREERVWIIFVYDAEYCNGFSTSGSLKWMVYKYIPHHSGHETWQYSVLFRLHIICESFGFLSGGNVALYQHILLL